MEKVEYILHSLKSHGNPVNLAGMQRFGIRFDEAFGCSVPFMRNLAKQYRNDHELALALWNTCIHEARIVAFLIDDPGKVTEKQMESWLKDVKSWDICDGLCNNLFRKTGYAHEKALEWSYRKEEFQKRAGFVMMAVMAVHDKFLKQKDFEIFLKRIKEESYDGRNFVKKAVNWALRQIGKRDYILFELAKETALDIRKQDSKAAKWIASDALREFSSETTAKVLEKRTAKKNFIT